METRIRHFLHVAPGGTRLGDGGFVYGPSSLGAGTFDVIEPMVAGGELPHLARWMGTSRAAPLPSVVPPVTFPAWSSFMTGSVIVIDGGHSLSV